MTTRPEQRSSGRFDTRCISWHRYGGAPRFGSAHFRLAAHTLQRTTFSFPDSVFDPEHFGTTDAFALADLADAAGHDVLDDYVEAQVHGVIDLAGDVEAVVLDPCYRGTPVEEDARGWGPSRSRSKTYRSDLSTRGSRVTRPGSPSSRCRR